MSSSRAKLRAVPSESAEPVSDAELIARALRGDRHAGDAIFIRHAPGVTQMVDRLLRDRAEAEDVVPHTFEVALRRLDRLERATSLRAWLLSPRRLELDGDEVVAEELEMVESEGRPQDVAGHGPVCVAESSGSPPRFSDPRQLSAPRGARRCSCTRAGAARRNPR